MYATLEQHEWFAHGDCGQLAFTINEITGWPVMFAREWPCTRDDCIKDHRPGAHMMVLHPSGRLLDIDGLHELDERPGAEVMPFQDDIKVYNSFFGDSITLGAWRADKESWYDLSVAQIHHHAMDTIARSLLGFNP